MLAKRGPLTSFAGSGGHLRACCARVRGDLRHPLQVGLRRLDAWLLAGGDGLAPRDRDGADERGNRLSKSDYDETTWSARTWSSFSAQKISVALHRAAALEIARALNISTACDSRDEASTGVTRPLCRGG